jgi:hypothetical protein
MFRRLFKMGGGGGGSSSSSSSVGSVTSLLDNSPVKKPIEEDEGEKAGESNNNSSSSSQKDNDEEDGGVGSTGGYAERPNNDFDPDMVILDRAGESECPQQNVIPEQPGKLSPGEVPTAGGGVLSPAGHIPSSSSSTPSPSCNNESSTDDRQGLETSSLQQGLIAEEENYCSGVESFVSLEEEDVFLPEESSPSSSIREEDQIRFCVSCPAEDHHQSRSFSPEKPEYNDWQFWKIDLTLPPRDEVVVSDNNLTNATTTDVVPSSIESPRSKDNSSQNIISVGSSSSPSPSGVSCESHYYYLIPCTDCLRESKKKKAEETKLSTAPRNPSVFSTTELGVCGHRRTFIQAPAGVDSGQLRSEFLEELLLPFLLSEMGNQPGKDKSGGGGGGGNKKGKSKDTSRTNSAVNLFAGTKTSKKNRPAPQPPPAAATSNSKCTIISEGEMI